MSVFDGRLNSTAIIAWLVIAVLPTFATAEIASSANEHTKKPVLTNTQHTIIISGLEFIPEELKLSSGDTVVWVNHDIFSHNITVSSNKKAISPDLAFGESFTTVVQDAMSYECGLHPSMKGKLVTN